MTERYIATPRKSEPRRKVYGVYGSMGREAREGRKCDNGFMKKELLIGIGVLALIVIGYWYSASHRPVDQSEATNTNKIAVNNVTNAEFHLPIDDFFARITKKPFGIYITPKTSPVQPEKFTGYHTGTDVEYGDVEADVPVYAIADGKVVVSRTASGYGGVLVLDLRPTHDFYALYGHVAVSSLPKVGTIVHKGDVIGRLGHAYSTETDGERKHLHFGIIEHSQPSVAGYVANKSALSGWADAQVILAALR